MDRTLSSSLGDAREVGGACSQNFAIVSNNSKIRGRKEAAAWPAKLMDICRARLVERVLKPRVNRESSLTMPPESLSNHDVRNLHI